MCKEGEEKISKEWDERDSQDASTNNGGSKSEEDENSERGSRTNKKPRLQVIRLVKNFIDVPYNIVRIYWTISRPVLK